MHSSNEFCTLSLHDALLIYATHDPFHAHASRRNGGPGFRGRGPAGGLVRHGPAFRPAWRNAGPRRTRPPRSEEHTSELQSLAYLVCRLLLEKKKTLM